MCAVNTADLELTVARPTCAPALPAAGRPSPAQNLVEAFDGRKLLPLRLSRSAILPAVDVVLPPRSSWCRDLR